MPRMLINSISKGSFSPSDGANKGKAISFAAIYASPGMHASDRADAKGLLPEERIGCDVSVYEMLETNKKWPVGADVEIGVKNGKARVTSVKLAAAI